MAVIVTLTGSASDDGRPNPPGALTYQWTKISGPGTVLFADAADPTTTATISDPGVYVLRLTASDGALFNTDDVMITVAAIAPDLGLVEGQQNVVGIGSDGFLYRTADFQTVSGSGGPTWVQIDLGIDAKIYSWVVDPFSPGYLEGVGEINGWIVNDTDIYRVEDLFGTPIVTSVHTFAVPTVGVSNHWRTIQASFGAFYAEGLNPWLVCVSYHGSTLGHEGTWAIRSEDGGVTWSAEVQISDLYDGSTDIPEAAFPKFGVMDANGEVISIQAGISGSIETTDFEGADPYLQRQTLIVAVPTNTERIVLRVDWVTTAVDVGLGSAGNFESVNYPTGNVSNAGSESSNFDGGGSSGGGSGSYTRQYSLVSGTWAVNRDNIASDFPALGSPVTKTDPDSISWHLFSDRLGHEDNVASAQITVTVEEIELSDGTIYQPSESKAYPIAVWTSPRTPGKAYTAAHVEQSLTGAPMWALYQDSDTVFSTLGVGNSALCEVFASEVGGQPGTATANCHLIFAPPVTTKRVLARGVWQSETVILPSGSSVSGGGSLPTQASVTHTDDEAISVEGSGSGGVRNGIFTVEWTFLSGDWPVNDVSIISSPPTHRNQAGGIVSLTAIANTTTGTASTLIRLRMEILELELDNGTIYYPSAVTDGFVSTDWGATWAAMDGDPVAPGRSFAGTIHVPWPDNQDESLVYHGALGAEGEAATPDELMPAWGTYSYDEVEGAYQTSGPYFEHQISCSAQPDCFSGDVAVLFSPPANAVRALIRVTYTHSRSQSTVGGGGSAAQSQDYDVLHPTGELDEVLVGGFTPTAAGGGVTTPYSVSSGDTYTVEWTREVGETDWPGNKDILMAGTVTDPAPYARWKVQANATATGGWSSSNEITNAFEVLEIELEDGTIYTPTGRGFSLKKVVSGVATDVSPSDVDRSYGVNRGPFGVRTFDGAGGQQYVLAAVVGNIGTDDPADDFHAVFISDDNGANWTQVVAPIPNSAAPTGRPAFEAAFAGDNRNVIFVWGPANYIAYSSNFGVAVDDRSGNLDSFGTPEFIGIAGGPTGA